MKHLTQGIRFLFMMMGLLCTLAVNAQTITVTGTVTDTTGEPLIGASVVAQGQNAATATDIDGNYTIKVNPNASLTFSYVGMNPQTIAVDGKNTLNVELSENSVMLGEVVAIGYGVVKKSDATGSVAMVKPDDVEAGMATSAQDLLVGASPGVVVTTNGGNPNGDASIRIRGGASLNASNDPLIVIDGVPMTNQSNAVGNPLTLINPQNIESMTILKDASATAIYGSRASNGVIIITTKKGTAGKPQINFAANWHVNTARKTFDMMDASTYRAYMEKYNEAGAARMGDANTDWQKEVLRTSFSQDYSLSIGGTAGFLPYRVSASYTNNQGIIKTSGMQRATVGFNLNPKFFNGKLSVNANVQGTWGKSRDADVGGALGGAIAMDPTLPIYKQWNTIGNSGMTMFNGYNNFTLPSGAYNPNTSQNPIQLLNDKKTVNDVLASNGNLQIDYALHFLPELHLNLNLGYEVSQNNWKTDTEANSVMTWSNASLAAMGSAGAATQYKKWELQRNTLLDFYLNYRKDFAAIKSNLDVMAGYSWQKFTYLGNENNFVTGRGFTYAYDPVSNQYDLNWNPASDANIGLPVNNSVGNKWAAPLQLVSFFGRLNYTFDDTYLLTFTIRDDGTSRFSKDNRWAIFPSLALGWKIANMPFFESIRDSWNDLKLRLGWGVTGQQAVSGYFPYMPIYSVSYQNGYQYLNPNGNGEWIDPIYPEPYDPNIKWEETTTWNIGIDAAWLNNRITLSADWYLRDTKDLLSQTTVYGVNTKDVMLSNIGSMRNMGVEVTIGAKPVVTKDFTWSTSYNVAYNKNKITALTNDANVAKLPASDRNLPVGNSGDLQWHEVGQPAFTFKVYEQVYDQNGDPIEGVYVDQNGDGKIDTNDLINFHTPTPDWTMTWNNNFNYKNWDLGISLRANIGNYVYNASKYKYGVKANSVSIYQNNNLLNNTFLFNDVQEQLALSSYFVENASFLRCDNITLGYTFNPMLKDRLNLRIFAAVQNPFVITKYKGLDPEVFSGIDNDIYPRPITCTLGLVATF